MSWKMFYRCVCDANFFFHYFVKLDRTSAVVSVHPWANSKWPIGQSERAFYSSYVIKLNSARWAVYHLFYNIIVNTTPACFACICINQVWSRRCQHNFAFKRQLWINKDKMVNKQFFHAKHFIGINNFPVRSENISIFLRARTQTCILCA